MASNGSRDTHTLSGAGPTDCDPNQFSSTRSEGCGIAAGIWALVILLRYYQVPHTAETITVQVLCDNQSAPEQADHQDYIGMTLILAANYDVGSKINAALHELGQEIKYKWVKAHQDDDNPLEELTFSARTNVICDTQCQHFW